MASPAGNGSTSQRSNGPGTGRNPHSDDNGDNMQCDNPNLGIETDHNGHSPPDSPADHHHDRITLDPGHEDSNASPSPNETSTITPSGEILPPVLIPPYWQTHKRSVSSASALSQGTGGKPAPIRMEDNTAGEEEFGVKSPLWARLVSIDGYTIVSGGGLSIGVGGAGDYVVWSCRVRMIDGGEVHLHKRYSEFEALRKELLSSFPRVGSSLPGLPAKSVLYRFRPAFLEKRRAGLEYFLNCVLLNPEFASSVVLKDFVFT